MAKFELQLHYCVQFLTNTLGERYKLPLLSNGLNNITVVPLQEWLWHKITVLKGWYAIILRNQIWIWKDWKIKIILCQNQKTHIYICLKFYDLIFFKLKLFILFYFFLIQKRHWITYLNVFTYCLALPWQQISHCSVYQSLYSGIFWWSRNV